MVLDQYESILQELGKILKTELRPDQNNTCLINIENVSAQIEVFKDDELLIASELGPVAGGAYRENIFREAMRANGLPPPLHGILGYGRNTTILVLFERIPLSTANGEIVAAALEPFLAKAKVWKEAISRGELPAVTPGGSSGGAKGIFGLRT